ncbi:MAG: ABC transporter ATP-binding protein, partial [Magnetococcus sp. WYHC-3]
MSAVPLLEAVGLTLARAGRVLVRDLALTIHAGEFWAVIGENGTGKSSLLAALAGLPPGPSTAVHLLGRPLVSWPPRQRARELGLLPQDPPPPFPATVADWVQTGRFPFQGLWRREDAQDRAQVQRALEELELTPLAHRDVTTLSGGERRRVEAAALLAQNPRVWLL